MWNVTNKKILTLDKNKILVPKTINNLLATFSIVVNYANQTEPVFRLLVINKYYTMNPMKLFLCY